MRYQEYKNKMMKVRKVLDFFHRFRFVFLGVAVVIAASITTLDLTKGNITKVSEFKMNYQYGEKIEFSGSAFMGEVTFEFRKKGTEQWQDETPTKVGTYEARAKSQGNHGYKYGDITTFTIKPIDTEVTIKNSNIDFGNDSPALDYKLLGSETLNKDYKVKYDDLTKNTTYANLDLATLKVTNKDGEDVTSCYTFKTETKEVTFNKATVKVNFNKGEPFSYTGEEFSNNDYEVSGDLFYGAKIEVDGGIKVSELGTYENNHTVKVVGPDGEDYAENYDIIVNDNSIQINKAPKVTITTNTPEAKIYDGQPFPTTGPDFDTYKLKYEVEGLLPIHQLINPVFTNSNMTDAGEYDNLFDYRIVDAGGNDASGYYQSIEVITGKLVINKRVVYIKSNNHTEDDSYIFDNTEKFDDACVEGVHYQKSSFVSGDYPEVVEDTKTKIKLPGKKDNILEYRVYHDTASGRIDVTHNYAINQNLTDAQKKAVIGQLQVEAPHLTFDFVQRSETYNGSAQYCYTNNNKVTLTHAEEEKLPEGWKAIAEIPSNLDFEALTNAGFEKGMKMRKYKEGGYEVSNELKAAIKERMVFSVYDENNVKIYGYDNGNSIGSNPDSFTLNDFTINLPTAQINKKDVKIKVADYNEEFNNKTLQENIVDASKNPAEYSLVSVDESTPLPSKDKLKVEWANNIDSEDSATIAEQKKKVKNPSGPIQAYDLSIDYTIVHQEQGKEDEDVLSCYNILPSSDDKDIKATITKRPITITSIPTVTKVYDDLKTFDLGKEGTTVSGNNITIDTNDGNKKKLDATFSGGLGTERVLIDVTNKTTSTENAGNTTYSVNLADIKIYINGEDLTDNYTITKPDTASVYIEKRDIYFKNTATSALNSHIHYDGSNNHGLYYGSTEYQLVDPTDTTGLVSGHTYTMNDQRKSDPDIYDYQNCTAASLGIVIKKGGAGDPLTSNYNFHIEDFYVHIIKTTININPIPQSMVFYGGPFESDDGKTITSGFHGYQSMSSLFNVTITCYPEDPADGNKFADGHTLNLTKYTNGAAAKYAGSYNFVYDWEITGLTKSQAQSIYQINLGTSTLTVDPAYFYVYCSGSGGKAYDGSDAVTPSNSDVSIYVSNTNAPDEFYTYYTLEPEFTNPYSSGNCWQAGDYVFPVTVGAVGPAHYGSIVIYASGSYTYKISRRTITIARINYSDGTSRIYYGGSLAPGDVLYIGGEPWSGERKVWGSGVSIYGTHGNVTGQYNIS